MLDNTTIKELKILKRVMETNSITKVAEELYINQPTISKMIRRFENQYNMRIFNRRTKFTLTTEGEILYTYLIQILKTIQSLEEHISEENLDYVSKIHIGLPSIIGPFIFPEIALKFLASFPNIELVIHEAGGLKIEDDILKGDIDLGFVVMPTKLKGFKSHIIYSDKFVVCVPNNHPFSNLERLDVRQLKEEKFICFPSDFMIHQIFLTICEKSGFSPNITFHSSQWDLILELVSVNLGIAIVPKILVNRYPNLNFKEIAISNPIAPWEIGVIYQDNCYLSIAVKNFIDIAKKTYK